MKKSKMNKVNKIDYTPLIISLKEKLKETIYKFAKETEIIDKFDDITLRYDEDDLGLLVDEIFKFIAKYKNKLSRYL